MPQEIRTINLGSVNCYLFKIGAKFLLVDTGPANRRFELDRELENAGCRPGDLNLILATHGDSDHVGNCAYLRKKYASPIALHRAEVDAVEQGEPRSQQEHSSWLSGDDYQNDRKIVQAQAS